MASIKKNLKEELKGKAKKIDFEGILNKNIEMIKKNKPILLGSSTESDLEVSKSLKKEFQENYSDLEALVESKINEFISDEMVLIIGETLAAYNKRKRIEEEIEELKLQTRLLSSQNIEDEMKIMKLEVDIDEKEDELKQARKVFMELYKVALEKTTIPEDLSKLFEQVKSIRTEEVEQREEEIELLRAKAKALLIFNRFNIVEDSNSILEKRINAPLNNLADKAVRSSKEQIPLIKVLIN